MSKIEIISKSDFIISFATILEENIDIKNTIFEAVKNGSDFVYMHPIDNADLKSSYSQFIKYEVGSEEGICALLLDALVKNCDENTKNFIDNLDLGYISAESSAGEEEFEEVYENSLEAKSKTIVIGNDVVEHERIENIIKLLALIKKYSDFNLVVLNEELENKINSCEDSDLEDIEDLKSFNGTLVYKLIKEDSDELIASQTFVNVAKVKSGDEVYVNFKENRVKKSIKVDDSLHGTIAILGVKNCDDIFSGYRYKQVKIEKVEA